MTGERDARVALLQSWLDVLGGAREAKDEQLAARGKISYLAYLNTAFDYYENLSRSLFHREIPQVLLIHASELTAECLDEVLTNLEKRGYRFISLEQALADPAYATPDLFIGPQGFSWLIRWKLAFGQKADWQNEPDPPEWIMQKSRELRKAKPRTLIAVRRWRQRRQRLRRRPGIAGSLRQPGAQLPHGPQ